MLQRRLGAENGSDRRWHSPDRDIAYCWPSLVRAVFDGFAITRWQDWFRDYFKAEGVTEEQLGQAAVAYGKYFKYVTNPEVKTPHEALEMAGFFDLPKPVQVAVCMKLGQVMTCAFFSAIRDVTIEGEEPQLDAQALYEAALRANFQFVGSRPWVRWVARQWAYLRSHVWPFNRRKGCEPKVCGKS